MKIEMMPTVNSWDIEQEFGIRVLDCDFAREEANDSYISLELTEDKINALWEELQDCSDETHYERLYATELKNELNLINKFRAMGYTENILVYVSW